MTATPIAKLPQVLHVPVPARNTPIGSEVYRGLTARPKTLSPWLFYDAEGSCLFEAITELPEYYVTRTERGILEQHADEIVALAAGNQRLTVIELGAGTATKTGLLLKAAVKLQGRVTYAAIDVSASALAAAKTRLERDLPGVTVEPRVSDYNDGLGQVEFRHAPGSGRRLVLYIGSSIGNFAPADALVFLREVRAQLNPGDGLLLGADMVKDVQPLLAAYNDAAGITAAFNLNALARINHELDANFRLTCFRHRAVWNAHAARIEMHLESLIAQQVSIKALALEATFERGESIHTENSYKFMDKDVLALLDRAGFTPRRQWSDAQRWFGVYLAAAR
jgi:dimethylhistidine N-methyltransferase